MGKKKRKNFKRDEQRLQAFLESKCVICYTPGDLPSRKLPCCKIYLHESCLLKCFQHASKGQTNCPHCRQRIYPLNQGQPIPLYIPEGAHLFRLEFETFAAKTKEQIADELWDYVPPLVPPPGWSQYRRMWTS